MMLKPLSPAQTRVAVLVARGLTYKAIGAQLGISARTVERYVEIASGRIHTEVEYGITNYRRVQRWALTTNLLQEIRP